MKNLIKPFVLSALALFLFSSCEKDSDSSSGSSSGFIKWSKCFGGTDDDRARSIRQTPDGGYILIGTAYSTDGDLAGIINNSSDMTFVVKCNASGQAEWRVALPHANTGSLMDIETTADGGYIYSGWCNVNTGGSLPNFHGGDDAVLVKLNAAGAVEWINCYGGSGTDEIFRIKKTSDGNFLLVGRTTSSDGDLGGNYGGSDIWLTKVNPGGNVIWSRNYGSNNYDIGSDVIETLPGTYVLSGIVSGSFAGNHGLADAFLIEVNSTGFHSWYKCYGGTDLDYASSIYQAADGGLVVAGGTKSNDGDVSGNHGQYDGWVFKTTSTGDLIWQTCIGASLDDNINSMCILSDTDIILVGETYSNDGIASGSHGASDAMICRTNSSGVLQVTKILGGSEYEFGVRTLALSDGSLIHLLETESENGNVNADDHHGSGDTMDLWLVKTGKP